MLAHRSWTAESILKLLWWMLAGLAVVALLNLGLDAWLREQPPASRQFYTGYISTLAFHAVILTGVIRLLRHNQLSWSAAFGFHTLSPRRLAWIAAAMASGLFVVNLLLMALIRLILVHFLQLDASPQPTIQVLQAPPDPWQPVLIAFMALLIAPVMEEILFRGLLYPAVKQAGYPRLALWGTALLFGLSHGHLLSFIPLVLFGLLMVWLYERTNNLLVPIFTHVGFNLINLSFALAFR